MKTLFFQVITNLLSTIFVLTISAKEPVFYQVSETEEYPLGEELTPYVALATL